MKRQLSPSRRDDDAVFVKDVVDKASKNPLFTAFLQNSTFELAGLPVEVIVNEIILRSLPRFVQLMLINKTLRKEIESIKNLYYILFKYHFPVYYTRIYDHLKNGVFYDRHLYFNLHERGWLDHNGSTDNEEMVSSGIEEVFGLYRFRHTTNVLELLAMSLPKQKLNILFYSDATESAYIDMCRRDTEMAQLVNRLFAATVPFGVPHPSYYTASHANLRHRVIMPLLDKMYNTIDENLQQNLEPLFMFIMKISTIASQNQAIIYQDKVNYKDPSSTYAKKHIRETLGKCTEVTPVYILSFLDNMYKEFGRFLGRDLYDYIVNTTVPLLNAMMSENEINTAHFVDTTTVDEFGSLFMDRFNPDTHYDNVSNDHWDTIRDDIREKLADLHAITFNKESLESIEKAEFLLDRVNEDGIDKWMASKEEKGVKENDLFRRLFYRALKKDGIDVARSISRDSTTLFGSYCHACPMEAIYEEGGVETPRLFCSHECLKMTIESSADINHLFM